MFFSCRHGIQNLRFRGAVVSLVAGERADENAIAKMNIESNKKMKLKVYNRCETGEFKISIGQNKIEF